MTKTKSKIISPAKRRTVIRQAVGNQLEHSLAFSKLPLATRTKITRDTIRMADYLTAPREDAEASGKLINEVDFPDFVADLLSGVFDANLMSSIDQMKAYAKLVAAVSKSVNEFLDENVTNNQARDYLAEQFPSAFKLGPRKLKLPLRIRRRLATERQQLLATMVLMGINRIALTKGKV